MVLTRTMVNDAAQKYDQGSLLAEIEKLHLMSNVDDTLFVARNLDVDLNKVYKQLEKLGCLQLIAGKFDSRTDRVYSTGIYFKEDALIKVDHNGFLSIVSYDRAEIERVAKATRVRQRKEESEMHLITVGQEGLALRRCPFRKAPLIKDNYTPEVQADYKKALKALTDKEPFGRLVILDGPQGTGKSYAVRAFCQDVPSDKAKFIWVPSNMVSGLAGPNLASLLLDHVQIDKKTLIMVIEDADEAIVTRDGSNESIVSTILNLTDGILGEILDVRCICTTNRKLADLDKAIKRAGRLAVHSHIGNLPKEQAQRVFRRLAPNHPGSGPERDTSLAEVYALAFNSDWVPEISKSTLGFGRA